jgi:membrane protease YdiL (CAAX protease family)
MRTVFVPAGAGMLSGGLLLLVSLGAYRVVGFQANLLTALGGLLTTAALFLGLAAFEEFLHRGYLFQNLIDGLGLPAAATLSCLLFAALHLINPGENLTGILAVLLAGILFVVLAVRTRCLWMAVGLHAAWDWAHFLFGVPCSGLHMQGGLLRMQSAGPVWLSGGSAGPEGSVLSLLLLGLAILYCSHARWISPNPDAALLWAEYVSPRE